jgi:branched-chain amino acid transport system ATP-binding protein
VSEAEPLLQVEGIDVAYGFLQALWGVSLRVLPGELAALLGPNGAGKTTTLRAICGLVPIKRGKVMFGGEVLNGKPSHRVARMGISYISEALNLFPAMTVEENLRLGAHVLRDRSRELEALESTYALFPRLRERRRQLAGTLSGGERKMLAIGRGVMSDPKLILVDEPSLGLAPIVTEAVFQALRALRDERGTTILLVEQNVRASLALSSRAYVLEQGRVTLHGESRALAQDPAIQVAYLGMV